MEDAIGYSYESLFRPYVSSALTEVWVEDPYIRHTHQVSDWFFFCSSYSVFLLSCGLSCVFNLTFSVALKTYEVFIFL